jgi:hypothetical protein
MGEELLKTGELRVNRIGIDSNFLLDVRRGEYSYEWLLEWAKEKDVYLDELYNSESCPLPHKPNTKKAEELVIEMQLDFIKQEK